ncbi:Uncharacterised protein [Bordetella ansorpii]|uniref:Uncharacterized protein n=1 Tax=Bordetella ansorpii TaxID=288768 RepID=A0A157STT8_9BORD|nr:hypothetical protein [Bordetella ansorpii]SAI73847.1 Uncharacterised protein [Bordetella ansorpii]
MTATFFGEALDEERLLRPAYLHARGYTARIFPDVLDKDGLIALATMAGNADAPIHIHHAEFGKPQQTIVTAGTDRAWRAFFDVSYADVILAFASGPLFAWLPSGERFHVVFGPETIIGGSWDREGLSRDFLAFVEDSGLTAKGKQFLRDAHARYLI